jgi:hypothetical protein
MNELIEMIDEAKRWSYFRRSTSKRTFPIKGTELVSVQELIQRTEDFLVR